MPDLDIAGLVVRAGIVELQQLVRGGQREGRVDPVEGHRWSRAVRVCGTGEDVGRLLMRDNLHAGIGGDDLGGKADVIDMGMAIDQMGDLGAGRDFLGRLQDLFPDRRRSIDDDEPLLGLQDHHLIDAFGDHEGPGAEIVDPVTFFRVDIGGETSFKHRVIVVVVDHRRHYVGSAGIGGQGLGMGRQSQRCGQHQPARETAGAHGISFREWRLCLWQTARV